MIEKETKPYGSWKSPITSSLIVESAIKLGEIVIDNETIYWNETRPTEKGRSVIVKWDRNQAVDALPKEYNARTRVHEYGGGSFTVHEGYLYFSHFTNQHFYSLSPLGILNDLTKDDTKRYANPLFDAKHHCIFAIEEEHQSEKIVINSLVKIDPTGENPPEKIHSGYDFYGTPALNSKMTQLAFYAWNHPNMPWDGTELFLADINGDGSLSNVQHIAGGINESIFQPRFAPDHSLYFISDQTGWWNLYRYDGKKIEACFPMEGEFGMPLWIFGTSRYDFISDEKGYRIACIYTIKGTDFLALLNPFEKKLETLPLAFTSYSDLHVCESKLIFKGASPIATRSVMSYDLRSKQIETLRKSKEIDVDPGYISIPETIEFTTEGGVAAFGFYYPPKNKDFISPPDEKPPLIVHSHGGPSTHVNPSLNLEIQYWTSRGFGLLDVNYGGSTGYGRKYRERLKDNWGIVDIDDCTNGALYLANQGRVDKKRLAIQGGSAGGYTTLACLTFRSVFSAGASYYGVSDLEALASDTHKFESRYLDGLIGPYPASKERYRKLSPIHHTENLSCPLILFQGSEDKIVPPDQSEKMYEVLKKKGIPVAYLLFAEEQHGFRIAENIKKALDAELYFYSKIFKFTPADQIDPIPIENLK